MGFFLQVKYRDRPDRWITVGVHPTRAQAARHGGRALNRSVAPSGADAVQVRVVTDGDLRREGAARPARAYRDLTSAADPPAV